jgi:thioredoxin reductase (NADPH)
MIDVLIVGAGPAGLSCAIEATRAGLTSVILEKGSVVDAIRRFPTNLTWFSTPELLEIGDIPFTISAFRPSRVDAINYYHRVCSHFRLDVRPFDAVDEIRRQESMFLVGTASGKAYRARNIVVATGYFDNPNRLDVPGADLGEVFYHYDEPYRFFGSRVTVVGGRNSAVEASLDLFRHGAQVTLVHRGGQLSEGVKYWILPDIQNRIKDGEITALFLSSVHEINHGSIALRTPSGIVERENDFTFVLIGFRPDVDHLNRFGVGLNPETLAPVHDEKTFETNVPGLYVAGSLVAGKETNKIFVENGRHHGAAIVGSILKSRHVV